MPERRTLCVMVAAACLLLCAVSSAAAAGQLYAQDMETCTGALDLLRGCSAGMVPHDLQQHCCIPLRALEGMGCFCDDNIVSEAAQALVPGVVAGLSACGLAGAFDRLASAHKACPSAASAAATGKDVLLVPEDDGDAFMLLDEPAMQQAWDSDQAVGAWALPLLEDTQVDPTLRLEVADKPDEDALDLLLRELALSEDPEEDSYTEGIDVRLGADDVVSIASGGSAELALWDGVLSIADVGADSADIIVSDGVSQVTVSVPDDMDVDLDITLSEGDTLVVATGPDSTSVFNADFADVGGMVHVIGQWMLGLLTPSAEEDRMDRSDEDAAMVGGLSRLVAEILAKLEAGMGGAPLDVEISYEMEDDESLSAGETEIDIEIDPELAPALTAQFLDERLLALSRNLNRAVLPSPVRAGDMSLLEASQGTDARKHAPALRNCFNSGVCEWLCAHRRGLQWALGLETLALLALLAFYARLNRGLARQQPADDDDDDAAQASLKVPLIVHAADYTADAETQQSPLWALSTKVGYEKQ